MSILSNLSNYVDKQIDSAKAKAEKEFGKIGTSVGNVTDSAASTINKAGNIIDQAGQVLDETDLLAYKKELEQAAINGDFKIFGSMWVALSVLPPTLLLGFKPQSKGIYVAGAIGSLVPIYICGKYIKESQADLSVKLGFGLPVAAGAGSLGFIFGRILRTQSSKKLNGEKNNVAMSGRRRRLYGR